MEIEVGSLRCMAPSLGIPPQRHYDPSDAEDAALRLEWAKFLFRAGYRLRYPQETTGTAVLLFHRFLIQERVGKHRRSRDVILTTCLFLAGKVTEAPRRLRDVINVLHMLTCTGQDEPPLLDKAYWTMKERIVEFEQVLLRTINFQVDPPDPYRLLLNYARSLRLGRAATRTAWGLVNDVLFCPRALSAPPPAVACAAIRLAARVHGSERRLRWFSPPLRKRKRGTKGGGGSGSGLGNAGDGGERPGGGDGTTGGGGSGDGGGAIAAETPAAAVLATSSEDSGGVGLEVAAARTGEAGASGHALGSNADARRDGEVPGQEVGGEATGARSRGAGSGVVVVDHEQGTTTPWWGLFDARDEEVELVCSELLALYRAHGEETGKSSSTASQESTSNGVNLSVHGLGSTKSGDGGGEEADRLNRRGSEVAAARGVALSRALTADSSKRRDGDCP